MRRFIEGAGTLLGLLLVAAMGLSAFVLFNAGLAYRTDCVTTDGHVRSSWSYDWNAPIPYLLAPSEQGCTVHNGTRVALGRLGLWRLPSPTVGSIALANARGDDQKFQAAVVDIGTKMNSALSAKDRTAFGLALHQGITTLGAMNVTSRLEAEASAFRTALGTLSSDYADVLAKPTTANTATFARDVGRLSDADNSIIAALAKP
jgi:hypothetical protein